MTELTRWFTNRKKRTTKPVCLLAHAMGEHIKADGTIPAWDWLEQSGLSVHALIYPNGNILRTAHDEDIAYHAGKSKILVGDIIWEGLNTVSLGAEFLLAGDHDYSSLLRGMADPDAYSDAQYRMGAELYAGWCKTYSIPVEQIVRHSDVSGDDVRGEGQGKRDPGVGFDMGRFRNLVRAAMAPVA